MKEMRFVVFFKSYYGFWALRSEGFFPEGNHYNKKCGWNIKKKIFETKS